MKRPDWKCAGCLCNHGGKVKQFGTIGEHTYCEQTYFKSAEKAGIIIDKQALAKRYTEQRRK